MMYLRKNGVRMGEYHVAGGHFKLMPFHIREAGHGYKGMRAHSQ
jgi:hypothetical protein